MWSDFILALRSLLRNRRRSLITIITVAVGSIAVVVFGGFSTSISLGLETSIARKDGHLHIYPKGYMEYGAANPTDYAIDRPDELIARILAEPEIAKRTHIAAPFMRLNGIAGNFAAELSKTFTGYGIRPKDMKAMACWDGYHLGGSGRSWNMDDDDREGAVVGIGMARMLNLCGELQLPCEDRTQENTDAVDASQANREQDPAIAALMDTVALPESKSVSVKEKPHESGPILDLLAASGQGAPNVVSVMVRDGVRQAATALDDMFVGMHLAQAQRLIYGGADKATAIALQLHSLNDAPAVKTALQGVLASYAPNLEIRELGEFDPMFLKVLSMFRGVFVFVAFVITIVVLFTVANTMTMSVMERTREVGTLRALGVRRSGIRRQFLFEGALIGFIGASFGLVAGLGAAEIINTFGLSWTPPSSPEAQPILLLPLANPSLLLGLWLAMTCVTVLSSIAPASRAARQNIVDAIYHV